MVEPVAYFDHGKGGIIHTDGEIANVSYPVEWFVQAERWPNLSVPCELSH